MEVPTVVIVIGILFIFAITCIVAGLSRPKGEKSDKPFISMRPPEQQQTTLVEAMQGASEATRQLNEELESLNKEMDMSVPNTYTYKVFYKESRK